MLNIVIDLETLDTKPSSVILSMGIVPFDPENVISFEKLVNNGLYFHFDKKIQMERERTISQDTLGWWQKQDSNAKMVLNGGSDNVFDLNLLLKPIYKLIEDKELKKNEIKWWSRGNAFDISIIDHFCDQIEMPSPWHFSNVRDVRTICDGVNELPCQPKAMIPHNALHDAAYDALRLQYVYPKRPWSMPKV